MSHAIPKIELSFTRGRAQQLREEIGDLPRSLTGPNLTELYRHLDSLLGAYEKNLKQQQRGVYTDEKRRR